MEYPWRKNSQRRKTDHTKMEAVTWGRFIWKVQIIRETLDGLKTNRRCSDQKIKQLIRSNRLSRITQKDKILLETEYHLQKILDLRTPMEVEQEPDLEVAGAVYENIPFFMESMVGVSREQETRNRCYIWKNFQRCQIFIR